MLDNDKLQALRMNIAKDLTVAFINRPVVPEIRKNQIQLYAANVGLVYNIVLNEISKTEE